MFSFSRMNELKETTQPLTLTKTLRFCHPPTQSGIKMYMNFARSKNRCAFFVKTLSINHADVCHFYNSYVNLAFVDENVIDCSFFFCLSRPIKPDY